MHLTGECWRRLEALFHDALTVSGEEREAFIERETGSDPALQDELRAMLRHAEGAGKRIAGTIERVAGRVTGGYDWLGRHFGPYRLVREIGRGGMGLVFEARRDDAEYDKRVALKVAPDWRDLDGLRERFRAERQILARLEHPNIARFLDGGTENGIPYFAMEYVDGQPITVWARERGLGLRERIGLFRRVCVAVGYAHENLIVHRDLKPSNILVGQNETPKLLDFGIATLLSPLEESTAATTGVRLWTPDYTSPEQVRGGVVTVRADIYSLGLILYELLCGERAQVVDTSSPLALDRSICETEPLPPSARAAARGEKNLSRQLKGDLDIIVGMAIRKEPERRYPSVAALDADLARFLDGLPVEARRNTPAYRFSKFIRRHRLASVAVAVTTLSVAGGLGATLYQARRAERRFEQLRGLANAFVFDVHDRIQYLPGATEARRVIVATALRYLENLRQDAGNDAGLLRELAAAYEKIGDVQGNPAVSNLGESQGALASYRHAESILAPLAAHGDAAAQFALASTTYKIGSLQHILGDPSGQTQLERARVMARQVLVSRGNDIEVLELAGNIDADLTRLASDARAPARAREMAQETAKIAQRMVELQPSSQESLDYLALSENSLASAYRSSGDLELSAQTYRAALKIREQLVRDHPENASLRRLLLITYGHLGDVLGPPASNGLGQLADSVEAFEKAAAIAESISQSDPHDRQAAFDLATANMRAAASLLEEPDANARALILLNKSEVILSRLMKEDPTNQRYSYYELTLDCDAGKALAALGRDAEAARRFEHARSVVATFRGGPNEAGAVSWGIGASLRLALLQAKAGNPAALALANEAAQALSHASAKVLVTRWSEAVLCARLGSVYMQLKQAKPAAEWLSRSAAVWRTLSVPAALEAYRRKALAAVEHDLAQR